MEAAICNVCNAGALEDKVLCNCCISVLGKVVLQVFDDVIRIQTDPVPNIIIILLSQTIPIPEM